MKRIDLQKYLSGEIKLEWLQAYADSLERHLAYVRQAGNYLGVPSDRLNDHDHTKYWHIEFPAYARQFYGDAGDPHGWLTAWLHHQNYNDHHWEYWVLRSGYKLPGAPADERGVLPMKTEAVLEMVADWMGATRAYNEKWDVQPWYEKHKDKILLHPRTVRLVESILAAIQFGERFKG